MAGKRAGTVGVGPASNDDEAIAAIRHAVESGVTWVDTAASYGLGHSEEMVARALRPWRIGEEVFVFTKCGHPWDSPDRIRTDLTSASIRRECEGSLKRLGVERIDLYQFHHADPSTPVEESWGTMAQLVEEGKVRWAGVSNFDAGLLERCESIRVLSRLRSVADRLGIGVGALAVAWTLAVEGVTGAICGARRRDQVDGWIVAADAVSAMISFSHSEELLGMVSGWDEERT